MEALEKAGPSTRCAPRRAASPTALDPQRVTPSWTRGASTRLLAESLPRLPAPPSSSAARIGYYGDRGEMLGEDAGGLGLPCLVCQRGSRVARHDAASGCAAAHRVVLSADVAPSSASSLLRAGSAAARTARSTELDRPRREVGASSMPSAPRLAGPLNATAPAGAKRTEHSELARRCTDPHCSRAAARPRPRPGPGAGRRGVARLPARAAGRLLASATRSPTRALGCSPSCGSGTGKGSPYGRRLALLSRGVLAIGVPAALAIGLAPTTRPRPLHRAGPPSCSSRLLLLGWSPADGLFEARPAGSARRRSMAWCCSPPRRYSSPS